MLNSSIAASIEDCGTFSKYPLRPRQPLAVLFFAPSSDCFIFFLQSFFAVDFGLLCGIVRVLNLGGPDVGGLAFVGPLGIELVRGGGAPTGPLLGRRANWP